jgi:hypothetical protein
VLGEEMSTESSFWAFGRNKYGGSATRSAQSLLQIMHSIYIFIIIYLFKLELGFNPWQWYNETLRQ